MNPTTSDVLPPLIFNLFKPARMGSFDVVRHLKRSLPKNSFGKIGHFGTLDPFACGVLMVGIGGAARLNELIHADLPKTYLAVGKLGIEKDTGDHEGKTLQEDTSPYLTETIASFDLPFIQKLLSEKFLGTYWQAPHQFSAAKYEGRPLHEWAREGVTIKKDKVERQVYSLEVVKWKCPYLSVRVCVSSGTYVRTLFSEMAQVLGTLGHLIALQRESVGSIRYQDAIHKKDWVQRGDSVESVFQKGMSPELVLPYAVCTLQDEDLKPFMNGVPVKCRSGVRPGERAWAKGPSGELMGLMQEVNGSWKVEINFAAAQASLLAERSR